MNKYSQSVRNDLASLADEARGMIDATADVVEEKAVQARERLAAALERGKKLYGRAWEKGARGPKVANQVVHGHPYQAIGIGVTVGAIIGFLLARRKAH